MSRRHYYLLTVIFVVGLVALNVSMFLHPGKLRAIVSAELDENLKVPYNYQRIEFVNFTTIKVSGITLRRSDLTQEPVFHCRELIASLDWATLIRGDIKIKRIELIEPRLYLKWDVNGNLDIPSVVTSSHTKPRSGGIPVIFIEGMEVIFRDAPFWNPERPVALSNIQVELTPRRSKVFPYEFRGAIADPVFGTFQVQGAFGEAQFRGVVKRPGFQLEDRHVRLLAPGLQELVSPFRMNGSMDVTAELNSEDLLDNIDIEITAQANDMGLQYGDYPTRMEELQGTLRYHRGRIEGQSLEFRLEDAPVTIDELVVDLRKERPDFRVRGTMEGLYLNEAFAESLSRYPEPFPDVRETLQALNAVGFIDVDFSLNRKEPAERVKVDVGIDFREANLTYVGFEDENGERDGYPYPFQKVVGTVRVGNDELEFVNLRSNVDSTDLVASGRVWYGRNPFGYEVEVRGRDIRLDDRVAGTLKGDDREIFESYRATGAIDFDLTVKRPMGAEEDPDVRLAVDLAGISCIPRLFPFELEDVQGRLVFGEGGGTRVDSVVARHGQTRVTIDGVVDLASTNAETEYHLEVTAADVDIKDDLLTALGQEFPDLASQIRTFRFDGLVDFACRVDSREEAAFDRYEVKMKGLGFRYEEYPAAQVTNLVGSLVAEGDRLSIGPGTTLECCGNVFDARGWIRVGDGEAQHDLILEARDFELRDEAIRVAADAVPFLGDLEELFDFSGRLGLKLRFKKEGADEILSTLVALKGVSVACDDPPLLIKDVYGTILVDGEDVRLDAWTAVIPYAVRGNGRRDEFILNVKEGEYRNRDGKTQFSVSGIQFENLSFEERVFDLLPSVWREGLEALELRGRVDGAIENVRFRRGVARMKGRIRAHDVYLDAGLELAIPRGTFVIDNALIGDDEFKVTGELVGADVKLHKFNLTNLKADFAADPRSFAVRKIQADALEGRINPKGSSWQMDLDEPRTFSAALSFTGAQLSRFIAELGGNPDRIDGVANGRAEIGGVLDDQNTWGGTASIEMTGDVSTELPFFAVVFEILNLDFLTSPGDSVQKGRVEARIAEQTVFIDPADFQGPGVNLEGRGKIGFDGICRLEFDPKPVKWLDPIPLVGEIVDLARGFVASTILVTGPIENPDATALNHLSEIIPPEEDSGRRLKIRPPKFKGKEDR